VRLRLLALTLALAVVGAFALPMTAAAAPPVIKSRTVTLVQNGQATSAAQGLTVTDLDPLTGASSLQTLTFTLERFVNQNGALAAVGTLTATDNLGTTASRQLTLPVAQINGSCQILHLELGPLDLDLLGLRIHLDRVVLDITAQSGPGNLLGNLLCAIAGLLDSNAPLNQLVNLLNQLLGLLR